MYTRREFGKTVMASVGAAAAMSGLAGAQGTKVPRFASRFGGVRVGAQTYCFRTLKPQGWTWSPAAVDDLMIKTVDAYGQTQIDLAEFWMAFIEPAGGPGRGPINQPARDALREWRRERHLDTYVKAKQRFNDAGIEIYSSMFNLADDLSDDEIEYAFDVAKTLGVTVISANCTRQSMRRVVPFADKHKITVAAHSEQAPFDRDRDGMAFTNNLEDVLAYSPNIGITLDTGHFTAFGGNVMEFVRKHNTRIKNLHLKDRIWGAVDRGDDNTPEWGKGHAPIREVLQLMKTQKYPFPACIEYEYASKGTPVEEVKRCIEYARAALA